MPGADQVELRPFTPGDLPAVEAFFRALSPDTRYRRFLTFSWSGPAWELDHLASDPGSAAVLAWDGDQVVGVGRAQRLVDLDRTDEPDGRSAINDVEVALVVADGWQHAGIGSRLGAALARQARSDGVRHIRATIHPDNRASLRLFRHGFPTASFGWDSGEIVMVADVA